MLGDLGVTWCWERRGGSALLFLGGHGGGPKRLAWWVPPALGDCCWDRSAEQLPLPQLLYSSAEAEWPEEIASVAAHFEKFVKLSY